MQYQRLRRWREWREGSWRREWRKGCKWWGGRINYSNRSRRVWFVSCALFTSIMFIIARAIITASVMIITLTVARAIVMTVIMFIITIITRFIVIIAAIMVVISTVARIVIIVAIMVIVFMVSSTRSDYKSISQYTHPLFGKLKAYTRELEANLA